MQELKISHKKSTVSDYLSVSGGAILFKPSHLLNADEMYKEADKYLYEAKKTRNTFKSITIE